MGHKTKAVYQIGNQKQMSLKKYGLFSRIQYSNAMFQQLSTLMDCMCEFTVGDGRMA